MQYLYLIIPAVFLIIEAVRGFRKGFLISVLSLLSWILSIVGSALLVKEFATSGSNLDTYANIFSKIVGEANAGIASLAAMFILMVVMIKLFCMVIMHFAKLIDDIPVVGTLNHVLGAIFGIIKGLVVIVLVLFIYAVYSGMNLDTLYDKFPQLMIFVDWIRDYMNQLWTMVQ